MTAAFPYLSENFKFQASLRWAADFKARHKIRQRKVTKFISKRDMPILEKTVEAAEKYQKQTKKLISKYIPDFVINTDQTGCNDQTTYNRSLDFQGVKTVLVKKKRFELTHSYTAQYSITASGKLLLKVFLCMQEVYKFGLLLSKKFEALENEFINVVNKNRVN